MRWSCFDKNKSFEKLSDISFTWPKTYNKTNIIMKFLVECDLFSFIVNQLHAFFEFVEIRSALIRKPVIIVDQNICS